MKKPRETPEQLRFEVDDTIKQLDGYLKDHEDSESITLVARKQALLEFYGEQLDQLIYEKKELEFDIEKIKDLEALNWKVNQLTGLEEALADCAERVIICKDEIKQRIKEIGSPELRKRTKQEFDDIVKEYEE